MPERDLTIYAQYREPNDTSKELIASVARRVFMTAPKKLDEDGNEVPVKSVKVYRVKYGDAKQLAGLLNDIFTGRSSSGCPFAVRKAISSVAQKLAVWTRIGL